MMTGGLAADLRDAVRKVCVQHAQAMDVWDLVNDVQQGRLYLSPQIAERIVAEIEEADRLSCQATEACRRVAVGLVKLAGWAEAKGLAADQIADSDLMKSRVDAIDVIIKCTSEAMNVLMEVWRGWNIDRRFDEIVAAEFPSGQGQSDV